MQKIKDWFQVSTIAILVMMVGAALDVLLGKVRGGETPMEAMEAFMIYLSGRVSIDWFFQLPWSAWAKFPYNWVLGHALWQSLFLIAIIFAVAAWTGISCLVSKTWAKKSVYGFVAIAGIYLLAVGSYGMSEKFFGPSIDFASVTPIVQPASVPTFTPTAMTTATPFVIMSTPVPEIQVTPVPESEGGEICHGMCQDPDGSWRWRK